MSGTSHFFNLVLGMRLKSTFYLYLKNRVPNRASFSSPQSLSCCYTDSKSKRNISVNAINSQWGPPNIREDNYFVKLLYFQINCKLQRQPSDFGVYFVNRIEEKWKSSNSYSKFHFIFGIKRNSKQKIKLRIDKLMKLLLFDYRIYNFRRLMNVRILTVESKWKFCTIL